MDAESGGVLHLQSFFRSKINVNTAEESGYSLAVFFVAFLIEMWSENCATVEETKQAIQVAKDFLLPKIEKAGLR